MTPSAETKSVAEAKRGSPEHIAGILERALAEAEKAPAGWRIMVLSRGIQSALGALPRQAAALAQDPRDA